MNKKSTYQTIGPGAYAVWRAAPLGVLTETIEQRLILELMGELDGRRVLDAGCGDAALVRAAASRGAGCGVARLPPRGSPMNDFTIALAIHVLAIVVWIGGVSMATTVILPAIRRRDEVREQFAAFAAFERRFAWQARIATVLAAASGFYMVDRLGLWAGFGSIAYWWLDAMVLVWTVFTVLLFIAEPFFLERWLRRRAARAPERTLMLVQRFHWMLLTLSLVTIAGAVAGAHGLTF